MTLSFIFEMLAAALRGYLFNSAKLAKYAKWGLRIRDYLNIFFPLDTYPPNSTGDAALKNLDTDALAVPVEAVKKEAKSGGFNLPFIKGM
jgi:hypothetical protein